MKKTVLSIVAVLAMLACILTACKSNKGNDGNTEKSTNGASEPTGETTAPETEHQEANVELGINTPDLPIIDDGDGEEPTVPDSTDPAEPGNTDPTEPGTTEPTENSGSETTKNEPTTTNNPGNGGAIELPEVEFD